MPRNPNPDAAVIPADALAASTAARVVPVQAKVVTMGGVTLGYISSPAKIAWGFEFRARRLAEIERLIAHRHGGPVDTDDFNDELATLAAELIGDPNRALPWVRRWIPRMDAATAERAVVAATRRPRNRTADAVAKMIGVTNVERLALGLRTIGAVDCPKRMRSRIRKQKQRERDEAARRAAGAVPRSEYIAGSVAEEARRRGVSRMTIHRERKRLRDPDIENIRKSARYRSECNKGSYKDIALGPVTPGRIPAFRATGKGIDRDGTYSAKPAALDAHPKRGDGRGVNPNNPVAEDGPVRSNHQKKAARQPGNAGAGRGASGARAKARPSPASTGEDGGC